MIVVKKDGDLMAEEKKSTYKGLTESRKRANDKYLASQDEIKIRMPKGKKDEIKRHAAALGQSVNSFINDAIDEKIERDREAHHDD